MSTKSNIEWTEFTWNPATGCTKISPGCKHCYAEVMADRLQAMGAPGIKRTKHANGREFQGRTWDDVPSGAQIRLVV